MLDRKKEIAWALLKLGWGWLLLVCAVATATAQASLSDCIDATCRITAADGSRGSGCVYAINQDRVFVLTAAHVVGKHQAVRCEFWQHGHLSSPLPATVVQRRAHCDVAVIALKTSAFAGRLPKAVPIAPASKVLRPGDTLASVGCANGSWSTGWKGHAIGYRGGDLIFTPTPADGRSGSAIFDADGTQIVGVLRARETNGQQWGIATSIQTLQAGFRSSRSREQTTQCGPGGCPTPQGGSTQRWLPYRQQQESNPYPTLPGPAPTPPAAPSQPVVVDLGPIESQLSGITDLLVEMRGERRSPEPIPVIPPPPAEPTKPTVDFEALRADLDANKFRTAQAIADTNGRVDKTQEAVTGLGDKVKEWMAANGSIRDRMQARLEKVKEQLGDEASQREIRIAYLKDLISEKLGGGLLASLGLPLALVIAAFLIRKDVKDKRETGDPLAIEKLWSNIGELKGRLHDRFRPDDVPPQQPPASPK